ncbi:DUF6011 domain-containing protein [Tomitella fengzijianii]|uniref:DUF6011 domain-containing protein n=1 Tax=Tomitella fengzijianii TaxID=2597660 RepID=UPI003556FD6C
MVVSYLTQLHDQLDADERRERDLLTELADRGFRISVPCRVCGQALVDPRSVARHIGPHCARRSGDAK